MRQPVHRPAGIGLTIACLHFALLAQAVEAGAQVGTVSGRVTDEGGIGIRWANVIIPGAQLGAESDSYGRFFFPRVPEGAYTIRARCVGYEPAERSNVHVKANDKTKVYFVLHAKYSM